MENSEAEANGEGLRKFSCALPVFPGLESFKDGFLGQIRKFSKSQLSTSHCLTTTFELQELGNLGDFN